MDIELSRQPPRALRTLSFMMQEFAKRTPSVAQPPTIVLDGLSRWYGEVLGINKVGREGDSDFFGRSLVTSPFGGPPVAVAQGDGDEALIVTIDLADVLAARTRRPFMRDRRPEFYRPISGN